jgi:uncharacterized zinc-type alcohol dehydrogenase-like protein
MATLFPDRDFHVGGDEIATHVRVDNWQFAFPLPDEITSEHAGPLMCAGATVFTPILQYGVRPTDRVTVVGVGGLGRHPVRHFGQPLDHV